VVEVAGIEVGGETAEEREEGDNNGLRIGTIQEWERSKNGNDQGKELIG
jgi:hypothetical protein